MLIDGLPLLGIVNVSSKGGTETLAAIVGLYPWGADSGRSWYVKIFAVFPLQGLRPGVSDVLWLCSDVFVRRNIQLA